MPRRDQVCLLELDDIPHHATIQFLKTRDADRYAGHEWKERCVEIMWGKFFMLDRVLDAVPDAEYAYWIDAGIANANVISTKYIAEADLHNYRLSEVASAFPLKLFAGIREFVGDRILALKTTQPHHPGIPAQYNREPYRTSEGLIAGLLGGRRERVSERTRVTTMPRSRARYSMLVSPAGTSPDSSTVR
jgi:hypothetical protein